MEKQPGEVREEIESTREALSAKLELLEEQTRDTITQTKEKVKQTFELTYHMEHRPWTMLGLSVALGYFLGRLSTPEEKRFRKGVPYSGSFLPAPAPTSIETPYKSHAITTQSAQKQSKNGSWIREEFNNEIALVKGAALGAVSSLVRDFIKQAVPQLTTAFHPQDKRSASSSISSGAAVREHRASPD